MIEFQGNTYKSFTALCKKFNVSLATFGRRRSRGLTLEVCLGLMPYSSRAVTFGGIVFKSLKALLNHYQVPSTTYWQRIQRGLSMRQALGINPCRPSYAGWQEMGLCNEEGIEIEKANYLLYEIINNINGKIYIGITTSSLKTRWSMHVKDSQTKQTPLYKAMRKYGVENLKIRLIREDAKSSCDLMRQETEEIKNRKTTDRKFGYNVASGGSKGNSKPFIIGGRTFPSRQEAAAHFGINIAAFNKRIRDKWTPEQVAGLESKSVITRHWVLLEDKQMNLMDAARVLNKKYPVILSRIRRGWTYRQAFDFDPSPSRNSHCARSKPDMTDRIMA